MIQQRNNKIYIYPDGKQNILPKIETTKKIPKRLFFIWIGDSQPKYVDYAINIFQKVNPSFEVVFKRHTIEDIESPKDPLLERCIDTIIDSLEFKDTPYSEFILRYATEKRTFCQIVANLYRYFLLYEYGGIYIDCDTFPLKPFDDKLLSVESFCPQIKSYKNMMVDAENNDYVDLYDQGYLDNPKNYKIVQNNDIFFIGQHKHYHTTVNFTTKTEILNQINTGIYLRNRESDPKFIKYRDRFFDCNLEYGEHYSDPNKFYIEHFCDRTWLKDKNGVIRSPKCKYDRYLKFFSTRYRAKNEFAPDALYVNKEFMMDPTDEDYEKSKFSKVQNTNIDKCNQMKKSIKQAIIQINKGFIPNIFYDNM